jgi:hypothetical protein
MKKVFFAVFVFFIAFSAFCGGNWEPANTLELVNTQEIELHNVTDVSVLYSFERVSVFIGMDIDK